MEFPQYRALPGGFSVYRIESETVFEEWQRVGEVWLQHRVEAVQYPEKVRINDMLMGRGFEVISEPRFLSLTKN